MAAFLAAIGNAAAQSPPSPDRERIRAQVARSNARFVSPDPAIVKVLLITPGAVLECSGAVISRNKVLTAAHCLIDDQGRWMPGSLVVIPGLDGWRREPWGRFEVTSAVDDGFDYATGRNDVAVLTVGPNARGDGIGDVTGWFERSPWRHGQDVQGYAGLVAEQQHESCPSVRYFESAVEHDCFVPKGTSGSPVFYLDQATGETYIVAVNSRIEAGRAIATRLRGQMWDFVEREVRDDRKNP
ncbi:MAG: trypsin-like peptidase domain-containing protein [Candidatus Tectomicrobia bacterium]|nr:trypsin-like peptidase domain-containing protein [Candidatus Tectomicrobia bacterium]